MSGYIEVEILTTPRNNYISIYTSSFLVEAVRTLWYGNFGDDVFALLGVHAGLP